MEKLPSIKENSIEKPLFLYHGTPQKNLESVDPKIKTFHKKEKELVFASPDRKVAISYLAKGDYSWSAGIYNHEYFIVLPITKQEFKENDSGGAVYIFNSKNFKTTNDRKDYEWVSEQKEKPIQKEEFVSALETIESNGIGMYFLDNYENYNKYCSIKSISTKTAHEFLQNFRK